MCWDPLGFADNESGVWQLEWQLARWVDGENVWDTITETAVLPPAHALFALPISALGPWISHFGHR